MALIAAHRIVYLVVLSLINVLQLILQGILFGEIIMGFVGVNDRSRIFSLFC